MTIEPTRNDCPEPQVLAAFAEGRLDEKRRAAFVVHLDTCKDCTTESALAIRAFVREQAASRSRWSRPRLIGAVAAGVIVTILGLVVVRQQTARPSVAQLVALAPRSSRIVEPRLTGGFAWAAYRGTGRAGNEAVNAERMKLTGAAGEVIERASRDSGADAQHAAGIALILVEQPMAAVSRLEAAAEVSNEAEAWSDLAAARYAAAADLQRASLYPMALSAADRALQLDPAMPEALFNRALILERMRLTAEARRAWTRYLAVDPSSRWAEEARARLAQQPAPSSRFERSRQQLELAASRGDLVTARELAVAAPEHARALAETELLGRWGDAVLRGDATEANRLLSVCRTIGDALAQTTGEAFLQATVVSIDRAPDDDRRTMAEGHVLYRLARIAYNRHRIIDAQRDLQNAATLLDRARSPMALVAAYYVAGARLAAGDVRRARIELEALRSRIDPRFMALGANIAWELGRACLFEDDSRAAIAVLDEGASTFRRIREHTRQAMLETLLAAALDAAGRGDEGWSARIRAFDALGTEGDPNLLMGSLGAARGAELLAGRREAALALARLEPPGWRAEARPVEVVDSLVQRALLAAAVGDDVEAEQAARAAESVAAAFPDPLARMREQADAAVASGAVRLRREPRSAIAPLTRAIDFYRSHELAPALPEPLLLRARAFRAIGDAAAAARDLEEGMRTVERNGQERARLGGGVFDADHALFDDALRLALDRGDTAGAFSVAERARGGTSTIARLQQQLAGTDIVVVEVAVLPEEIVTFAVGGDDAMVARRERSRREVVELANASLREEGTRAAAVLYDEILRPVDAILVNARAAVVIPDRTLQTVPFAALYDSQQRRHVVERLRVATAASASALVRKSPRPVESLVVLALASGEATQTRGLPAVGEEADDIVPFYRRATAVPHDQAALSVLAGAEADVIHIAGHTESQAGGGEQALLFGAGGRIERVSWRTIAAAPSLRAEVVVLAACETLRPPASAATRGPSLGAAFASAGAIDVVGTLAAIPDREARLLFRRIHRELASGAGVADAVRAAQLESIRGGGSDAWKTVSLLTRRIPAKETIPWQPGD